ncbi:MAG TPA: NfeD family protein [Clostridia bacterium]|nr:NfeD family protein [Clostridia bacterium]
MTGLMIFWLVAVIALAIFEIVTVQLVAIWFSVGALGALAAATLGYNLLCQAVVFIVISAVLLVLTRPMCRKFLTAKKVNTNADRHIGSIAIVQEEINNLAPSGAAIISGVTWMARSVDGSIIHVGEKVRVERIEGVKLIVSKCGSASRTVGV